MDNVRVSFLEGLTKLSLWFVGKLVQEGTSPFSDVLNRRVNIYRHTDFYDGKQHPSKEPVGKAWYALVDELEGLFESNFLEFENAGFQLLWPHIEARIQQSDEDPAGSTERPYECWTSNVRAAGVVCDKTGENVHRLPCSMVEIHIDNVYKPKSPFSEMKIPFAASLIRLLEDSQRSYPDVKTVRCESWMNSSPGFSQFFPPSWTTNPVPIEWINYEVSHWGQFEDRRGDFHRPNGERFRSTGKFPFRCTSCSSPIEEVLLHLRTRFPEAV
ncbi:MAG: hypothetical protein O2954_02060 [bacterium]|nr:hypothetical protein [bacterium]